MLQPSASATWILLRVDQDAVDKRMTLRKSRQTEKARRVHKIPGITKGGSSNSKIPGITKGDSSNSNFIMTNSNRKSVSG